MAQVCHDFSKTYSNLKLLPSFSLNRIEVNVADLLDVALFLEVMIEMDHNCTWLNHPVFLM